MKLRGLGGGHDAIFNMILNFEPAQPIDRNLLHM